MADRRDDRHAQERDGPAEGLVAEGQQVGERAAAARHDRDVDVRQRCQLAQRAADRGRGMAVLHRGERPDQPAGPAAAPQPGEHVVARLAPLAADDADRARERRARDRLLRLAQPLGDEATPHPLDAGEQIALAGDPQAGDREGEVR
jgi:hypothetical protein